jgi:hypothetical protein
LAGRGGVAVAGANELRAALEELYAFDEVRARLGEAAAATAAEMMGASARTIAVLRRLMGEDK